MAAFITFQQAVIENNQEVALQEQYYNDPDFAALTFIPPSNVAIASERLYEVILNTSGITADALSNYFEDTYVVRFGTICTI